MFFPVKKLNEWDFKTPGKQKMETAKCWDDWTTPISGGFSVDTNVEITEQTTPILWGFSRSTGNVLTKLSIVYSVHTRHKMKINISEVRHRKSFHLCLSSHLIRVQIFRKDLLGTKCRVLSIIFCFIPQKKLGTSFDCIYTILQSWLLCDCFYTQTLQLCHSGMEIQTQTGKCDRSSQQGWRCFASKNDSKSESRHKFKER